MPKFSQFARAKRRFFSWQGVLVCLAILCLDSHLASRFRLPLSTTATLQSNSAKVQHMDRDAHRWMPPIFTLSVPTSTVPTPLPEAHERGYLSAQVRCLYARSPPVFL